MYVISKALNTLIFIMASLILNFFCFGVIKKSAWSWSEWPIRQECNTYTPLEILTQLQSNSYIIINVLNELLWKEAALGSVGNLKKCESSFWSPAVGVLSFFWVFDGASQLHIVWANSRLAQYITEVRQCIFSPLKNTGCSRVVCFV